MEMDRPCVVSLLKLTPADIEREKKKLRNPGGVRGGGKGNGGKGVEITITVKSLTPEDIKKIKEDLKGKDEARHEEETEVGMGAATPSHPSGPSQPVMTRKVVSPGKPWHLMLKHHNQWARKNGYPTYRPSTDKKPEVATSSQDLRPKRSAEKRPSPDKKKEKKTIPPELKPEENGNRSDSSADSLFIRVTPKKKKKSRKSSVSKIPPIESASYSAAQDASLLIRNPPNEESRKLEKESGASKTEENSRKEEKGSPAAASANVDKPATPQVEKPVLRVDEPGKSVVPTGRENPEPSSSSPVLLPIPSEVAPPPPLQMSEPVAPHPTSERWMDEVWYSPQFDELFREATKDDVLPDVSLLEENGPDLKTLLEGYEREHAEAQRSNEDVEDDDEKDLDILVIDAGEIDLDSA